MAMGACITHRAGDRCFRTELRRFRAFFGVSPSTASLLWGKIKSLDWAPRSQAKHILWALLLMKVYDSEEVMAGFLGVDEETFSIHAFEMVKVIARLKPYYVRFPFGLLCCCVFSSAF